MMVLQPPQERIRALVIDDSAYNRATIAEVLESSGKIEVVGRASNGEEGLRLALTLKPDVITLDLEMPKMDGFTFLRILMGKQPTPVIIISSYGKKQNVFKALELGALDFIAKPTRHISPELGSIRDELVEKVLLVRQLQTGILRMRLPQQPAEADKEGAVVGVGDGVPEIGVVVIGASTGGPPALQSIFQGISKTLPLTYFVAQHMPENFTRAFADRLNRYTGLKVKEAEGGEIAEPGHVFVAPGGKDLKLIRQGKQLKVEVAESEKWAKYVPSIDELFQSVAIAMGNRVLGILLTGMGADGRAGIMAVKAAGGQTIAESHDTAVIFGMPKEAIDTGSVDKICRLDDIPAEVERFARKLGARLMDGDGR